MVEFKNKKSGMTLAEVILALLICCVIITIAGVSFSSKDFKRTPYLMSILKNIPEANTIVMHDCYEEGTCNSQNQLPDSTIEYCTRLADVFLTTGNADCITTDADATNFKMTNGVSYFNFNIEGNQNWHKNNIEHPKNYIDIVADINGDRGENINLIDRFAFRIFKNGEIVPNVMDDVKLYEREDLFAYKVFINKAEVTPEGQVNSKIRVVEPVDTRTDDEIEAEVSYNQKISFKRAVCMAHGAELLQRYYGNGESCNGEGYQLLPECNFNSKSNIAVQAGDNTAFCFVQPTKPMK